MQFVVSSEEQEMLMIDLARYFPDRNADKGFDCVSFPAAVVVGFFPLLPTVQGQCHRTERDEDRGAGIR